MNNQVLDKIIRSHWATDAAPPVEVPKTPATRKQLAAFAERHLNRQRWIMRTLKAKKP